MVETPHKDTFKNGNREWKYIPTKVIFREKFNKDDKTDEQRAARVAGLLGKEKERRIRLKELSIDYEFPGYQAIIDQASPAKSTKKSSAKSKEPVESPKTSRKTSMTEEKPKKETKAAPKEEKKSAASKSTKKSKK